MHGEKRSWLSRLFVGLLWVLGFFAVFGIVGLIVIIIRDTNKPPPNPYRAMESLLQEYAGHEEPFIVLVARNGHVVFTQGQPDGVDADTPFFVNGISDTFVAMGLGVLVDRDVLSFEQSIGELLPNLPNNVQAIKLGQLINHTSGLDPDLNPQNPAGDWVVAEPNTLSRYAAINVKLQADILQRYVDQPLNVFMQETVFTPAGLTHSRVEVGEDQLSWYASANDLFAWDQVLFTNRLAPFQKVMFHLTKLKRLNNGALGHFAGGWFIGDYRGLRIEVATAFDDRSNAAMARFSERRFVSVVLTEMPQDKMDARSMMRQIAEIYLGREMPRPVSDQDEDGTDI